jgi:23S rRNA (adenine2503-C2)-methyltransferase
MNTISEKQHILDYTLDELKENVVELQKSSYRANQIFLWIYHKRTINFEQMSNLGKKLRVEMDEKFTILTSKIISRQNSSDKTIKCLFDYGENRHVEAVLIPAKEHLTACLSTQFGCQIKCAFCATGKGPFLGNMTAGQIIEQFLQLQIEADRIGQRISHIVFMGMGEPLMNYDNVLKAIRILNSDWGFKIGARKITISTAGIPKKIRQLAEEKLQINLALSLHAVHQNLREELIPLAKKYSLDEILKSVYEYFEKTGREVTLEYLMLKDLNCSDADADKLASIAKRIRSNVNLIPYNPTENDRFTPPSSKTIERFLNRLRRLGANTHMRASRGQDIKAACGQLRKRTLEPTQMTITA